MTTVTHTRNVHIDAPVERVFDHVKHPENFYEAMHGIDPNLHAVITKMEMAPDDGVGSVYAWETRFLMIPYRSETTREEFVPNERIVDHTANGVTWSYDFEPEADGTKLTMSGAVSSDVPGWAKVEDKIAWKGEDDLGKILATFKAAIEA